MSVVTEVAQVKEWPAVRLKYFTRLLYGLSQPPTYQQDGIPFVRATNVNRGKLLHKGLVFVSEELLNESRTVCLMLGDIIVVRSGAYTGDSAIVDENWAGGVAGFDIIVRVTRYADPRFVAFSLLSPTVLNRQILPMSDRAAQPHLNAEELGDVLLQLPTIETQSKIADYLDRETAQLDALVAAKERLLGLLAEKRRALITRAVIRGLDPRAPLRDSGIPWLGAIPAHWETPPVYARFEVQLGKMLDEKKIKGAHLAPYIRNVDVQWGVINTTDLPEMDFDEDDRLRYALRAGDILVCEGGEVGRCALWDGAHEKCYYQKALHRLRPIYSENVAAFFVLVMQAIVDSGQFALQSSAATIQHLPAEKLRVVRYPAPPCDEQQAIVTYVSVETSKLNALRAATERTIALLKERRSALIAAAVTGQLNLRASA